MPQQQQQQQKRWSNLSNVTLTGRCLAGLRCSPCAAAALLEAGWLPQAAFNASVSVTSTRNCRMLAAEAQGVCLRCQIGKLKEPSPNTLARQSSDLGR
jgi:hypothetical protein